MSRPYNWAIRELNLNIHNPADKIKLPNKSKKNNEILHGEDGERFIKRDELYRFFDVAQKSHYYYAYRLLYFTGLRPSECLGLKWEDIKNGSININRSITAWGLGNLKTQSSRRKIPLNEDIIDCLWLQYKLCRTKEINSEWVFPQTDGKAATMNSFRLAFDRARNKTIIWKKKGRKYHGIEVVSRVNFSLYDFRHTFATLAAYRMTSKQLQYIMGHANIETTLQLYAKFTKNQINDAGIIMSEMLDDHHK